MKGLDELALGDSGDDLSPPKKEKRQGRMDLAIVGDVEVIQQDDALGRLLLLHLGKEVPLHILHDLPPDLVGRHGHEGQMKRQLDIVVARLLVPVDRIELLSFCVQGETHKTQTWS